MTSTSSLLLTNIASLSLSISLCVYVYGCRVLFLSTEQILNELLLLHIITNNPAGIDGPVFTDELVNGQSLSDKYGEGLNVEVAYYKTNVKAVYTSPADSTGPAACVPKAKWIDINFPVCGGSIAVHIVSQVMLPLSCTIFPTIEEIALDTPELSLLAEAFSILDGAGVVIGGSTQFAPTNLAWNRAFLLLGSNKDAVFNNVPLLTDIVLYNRVVSSLPICKLSDDSTLITDPVGAFNPQSNFFEGNEPFLLKVSIKSVLQRLCGGQLANQYIFRRIVISSNTNSAKVLVPDIQACDGRVYITDAVLLPATLFFSLTLMDLVCSASILSTLCSIIRDTPVTSVLALLSSASVKLVLFAPTNFAISSALQYLRIDNSELEVGDLEVLLAYHVAEVDPFNADPVFTFQFRDEVDSFENLEGLLLTVVVTGNFPLEGFFIDGGCNRAQILVPLSNRVAVNGVLHVIDRLLLPPFEQKFCPSPCGRLELNPLTTVFIAAIYALGLDNEYCTVGASFVGDTYEPPRLDYAGPATVFAPSDLAFAKQLFQGGLTVATIFSSYPERLYDTILYHTIEGVEYFTSDLFDEQILEPSVTNTGFFPITSGHIETDTFLTARRFDSFSFIRKNLLNTAVFIEGQRCTFSLNPSDCAGRIIVPDQRTLNGGDQEASTIIQVIDQVLTPPFVLDCIEPAGSVSGPATSISIAAEVQYVGPVGCSLFCVGHLARCLPCSPFVAQEIYTSPVNGQLLSNQPSRIVYTLYVNQIGEVRWGQVPGLVRSKWESDHAIGPVGLIKAGTSIVAQGFLATNLKIFNVIANAIDVTTVTTEDDDDDIVDAALLKIYIDGILRGAALADFTSIISLAEIQARITELISTKYVIDRPLFDIRAGNYFGPLVRPSGKGIVGPIESLLGPFEGGTMSLVDASEMEDGDAALGSAYTSANDTIAAMQAIGEGAVTAQTIYYSLRTGLNPVEALGELFDGIDGVGFYERNGFPDVLATTEFYKNCGPIFNQYKNVDGTGASDKFSPCGISAVYFQEWAGVIFRLAVYANTEVFPSQCVGQPFGRPLL